MDKDLADPGLSPGKIWKYSFESGDAVKVKLTGNNLAGNVR